MRKKLLSIIAFALFATFSIWVLVDGRKQAIDPTETNESWRIVAPLNLPYEQDDLGNICIKGKCYPLDTFGQISDLILALKADGYDFKLIPPDGKIPPPQTPPPSPPPAPATPSATSDPHHE